MKEIPLSSRKYPGLVALVDDEDYERVAQYTWHPSYNVTKTKVYARTSQQGAHFYMHTFLRPDLPEVDHKDGNGLNNQQLNLREATRAQQLQNRAKQSGPVRNGVYKGVYRVVPEPRVNKWRAEICKGGIRKHIGVFPTAEDAALAYDATARVLFGEYAKTNFES